MKKPLIILFLFTAFTCSLSHTAKSDEISDLKNQLKAMQKQMQEQARVIEEMQRKIEKLETEKPAEKPSVAKAEKKDTDFRAYWKDGIRLETADKNFTAKIGGRIQADFGWMNEDSEVKGRLGKMSRNAEFRRLRGYLEGAIYKDFIYKGQVDVATGDAEFRDVYLGMKNIPYLGILRVGQFTEPFSLEDMTSSNYITFLERSLPYALSIHRQMGLGFNSAHFDERMTLSWSAFFNADDQAIPTSNAFNTAARLTGLPWYEDEGKLLHLGAAYAYRNPPDGNNFRYYSSPDIHLAPNFVDTGDFPGRYTNLVGLESALIYGPLSLQGEFMQSFVNLKGSGTGYFKGLYGTASYFLTGEHKKYDKYWACISSLTPKNNFYPTKFFDGSWGAWELAARYSYLDLCTQDINGGVLSDYTLGINWYWNTNMKIMGNYVHSHRNGIGDADIVAVRCQVYF